MNVFVSWASNTLGCLCVYAVTGAAFLRAFPAPTQDVRRHVVTSLRAIPLYALLPTACDALTRAGLTRAYPGMLDRGVFGYVFFLAAHLALVEVGVYWVHRALHHPRLYWLHQRHHSFKERLTPFAGLAFAPADGLLQAFPYALALLLLPIHAGTHKLLLFSSGTWAAYIHSADTRPSWLLLGPRHHAVHHRTFKHNYGHYTQAMDAIYGTLSEKVGAQ